jgi:hypothetical protein
MLDDPLRGKMLQITKRQKKRQAAPPSFALTGTIIFDFHRNNGSSFSCWHHYSCFS